VGTVATFSGISEPAAVDLPRSPKKAAVIVAAAAMIAAATVARPACCASLLGSSCDMIVENVSLRE